MAENLLDHEEEPTSTKSLAIKYGLILGAVNIIYTLIILYTGLLGNTVIGILSYGIFIAFLFLGMKEYKTSNDGIMTFGKGFGIGALASVIAGGLIAIFFFFYLSFVDDYLLKYMIDFTVAQIQEQGQVDANAMDMVMNIYENYVFTPIGYPIIGFFSNAIMGVITSLIVAAIIKKNPDVPY